VVLVVVEDADVLVVLVLVVVLVEVVELVVVVEAAWGRAPEEQAASPSAAKATARSHLRLRIGPVPTRSPYRPR
jgi:hypothetical protein